MRAGCPRVPCFHPRSLLGVVLHKYSKGKGERVLELSERGCLQGPVLSPTLFTRGVVRHKFSKGKGKRVLELSERGARRVWCLRLCFSLRVVLRQP